jgi:acetolactate synthase-1/2/3 large subunit
MPVEIFTQEPLSAPEAILRVLEEAGIETIFGVPGGHTGHIYNAAEAFQNSIRTVLVRQESLAGVMAEVTGRVTGKPGVIMGQGSWVLGHGIIGTLEAHLSSTPMLLLTEMSDTPGWDLHAPYQAGTGDYGGWDAKQAFEAITKQVFVARDPLTAVHATQLAIKHALAGQPGPVALLYSRSALVSNEKVGPESFPFLYKTRYYLPPAPPPAAPDLVKAAAAAIAAAERPILLAGNGVRIGRAEEQLRRFAEATGIPVVTSATGKGVIAENHSLALGPVGTWGTHAAGMSAAEADLVIVAGSKLGSSDIGRMTPKLFDPRRQTFVQIEIEPRNSSWTVPAEHVLTGSVGTVLDQLAEAIAPAADAFEKGQARVTAIREEYGHFSHPSKASDSVPLFPQRIIAEMERVLPEDAIVTCDAGENRMLVNHHYMTRHVGGIIEPAGAGAMGFAIPAAMAVKLAFPNRMAVAVVGDGGFAMSLNGLISAREQRIPIAVVIFNNSSLGAVVNDTGSFGALFDDFDHARMAEGMGCIGIRVTTPDEIAPALERARDANVPVVIDFVTSPEVTFRDALAPPLGSLSASEEPLLK